MSVLMHLGYRWATSNGLYYFFFFFFFGCFKNLSWSLSILLVAVLFAVLSATEARITVENLHAESMEVTWAPMQAELQAKSKFLHVGTRPRRVLYILSAAVSLGEAGFLPFGAVSGTGLLLAKYWELIWPHCIYCSFRSCATEAEAMVSQIFLLLFFVGKTDHEKLFFRFWWWAKSTNCCWKIFRSGV